MSEFLRKTTKETKENAIEKSEANRLTTLVHEYMKESRLVPDDEMVELLARLEEKIATLKNI